MRTVINFSDDFGTHQGIQVFLNNIVAGARWDGGLVGDEGMKPTKRRWVQHLDTISSSDLQRPSFLKLLPPLSKGNPAPPMPVLCDPSSFTCSRTANLHRNAAALVFRPPWPRPTMVWFCRLCPGLQVKAEKCACHLP